MKQSSRRNFLSALGLATAGSVALANPVPSLAGKPTKPFDAPNDIKITDLTIYKIKRGIFIKIDTNAGLSGWGESSSNSIPTVEALILHEMKDLIIGRNPFDSAHIWEQIFWQNHDYGPSGALTYAVAGIDLALWDIKGKVLNQPVYNLLGGKFRTEMPAYAGIPLRGGKIPIEEAIDRAQKLVALGFKTIKLRMQIREYNMDPIPDPTVKYYEAIRKALPGSIALFVDPNEGYTASRAIQVGEELQRLGMKYYESPCPRESNRDTREVVEALNMTLMAGEKCYTRWEFRDLILEGNPDIINPDLIKAGGISEVQKIATIAQTFFKKIVPHNTKPTLGTAAALHLMASIPNAGPFIEFVELDTYDEVLSVVENPISLVDGKLPIPTGPGLGLVVNEQRLQRITR